MTTPTPETAPPQGGMNGAPKGFDESFSPEELAYFNSRGASTDGLLDSGGESGGAPAAPAAPSVTLPGSESPLAPAPAPAPTPAAASPLAGATPAADPVPAATPAALPLAEATPPADQVATGPVDLDDLVVGEDGRMRNTKGQFVPHAALAEARNRFKQERTKAETAAQEATALREKMATLEGRLQQLLEPKPTVTEAAPAVVEDTAPDPETDIFGFVKWQGRQIAKLQETITKQAESTTKTVEEVRGQMTEAQMLNAYRQDAQAFNAAKPEFGGAYRHLIDNRHAELALMGYNDATERSRIIHEEERGLVQQAYKLGKRPAEFLFNVAVTRGYRSPAGAAPAPAAPAPAPAPTPAAIVPAPTPPVATATPAAINAEAQRLQNAAAAQNAAATLSGAGGAGGENLTAEAIAAMSETDFAALQKRLGPAGMRQFMGG